MNVLGHRFEIIICKRKKEVRKYGHLTWSENFVLRMLLDYPFFISQENIVVYSYNNPTKIKDQVTFARLGIYN